MSQRNIENHLNQVSTELRSLKETINQLGSSFESYKIENKFWIQMISQKIFNEVEIKEIKHVEKLWYRLAVSMPKKQPLNLKELELLANYNLIDGAQMAHLVSKIGK